MATLPSTRATPDDLMRTEGKAELIGGKVVQYMAVGVRPSQVAANVYVSLHGHSKHRGGDVFTSTAGYLVPELPSGRESFSPDTSYYDGPLPQNLMRFVEGGPTFAVEVRSQNSYTPSAEAEMAAKRRDYFAAGTKVVWDVDPIAEVVDSYRADAPDKPARFNKKDVANAEPAVPGCRISGDDIFG